MSVPFLPASLIQPIYSFLQLPTNLIASESVKLERISKYCKKRWLTQIRPEEQGPIKLNLGPLRLPDRWIYPVYRAGDRNYGPPGKISGRAPPHPSTRIEFL